MNLEINLEAVRKNRLFVPTPMYGGMANGMYMKSMMDLNTLCMKYGIECRSSFIFNESLITRARNYLTDEFLRAEEFTHLLFIDADIHFDPKDIIAMLALDKDVVGAPYPKKSIKWHNVKQAVQRHPDIDSSLLEKMVGDYVFNPAPGLEKFSVAEPIEVLELGTGLMMVKREVFSKFREAYPEFRYKPDHGGQVHFDGTRYIHAYFDTVIDSKHANIKNEILAYMKNNPDGQYEDLVKFIDSDVSAVGKVYSDRYLSEDYMFCQWWRNIGGKIWLCPWMKTQHVGTYAFTGDMPAIANYVGTL